MEIKGDDLPTKIPIECKDNSNVCNKLLKLFESLL